MITVERVFRINLKGEPVELTKDEATKLRDALLELIPLPGSPKGMLIEQPKELHPMVLQSRHKILEVLDGDHFQTIKEVSDQIDLGPSSTSAHLRNMYGEGILVRQRRGKQLTYKLRERKIIKDRSGEIQKISSIQDIHELESLKNEHKKKAELHRQG